MDSSVFFICMLIGYVLSIWNVGKNIVFRYFLSVTNNIFFVLSSILVGVLVSVPITYTTSCLFYQSSDPILYGILCFILLSLVLSVFAWRNQKEKRKKFLWDISELVLLFGTFVFGSWLMWKTLRVGVDGIWLVSKNTVFDNAHAISLIRSFSWGNNIPFLSPYAAGMSDMYHFFFYFFVASLERLGMPLIPSFNVISAAGFSLYLMMAYYLVRILLKESRMFGWVTVVALMGHSTMTWLYLLLSSGFHKGFISDIWNLQMYPFAGPYDGSIISLFFTLNVFVNQRHLAFGIAISLWLFLMMVRSKRQPKSAFLLGMLYGLLVGILGLWNIIIYIIDIVVISLVFLIQKKKSACIYFLSFAIIVGLLYMFPFLQDITENYLTSSVSASKQSSEFSLSYQIQYWFMNLGIAIPLSLIGLFTIQKKVRTYFIVLIGLFMPLSFTLATGRNEIAQKILNYWNVALVMLAVAGIVYLWRKNGFIRFFSILSIFCMLLSGVIDLMVIKNDFMFPGFSKKTHMSARNIAENSPKSAIILSYKEMFHPVALAGRRQYNGFFASPKANERNIVTQQIFEATSSMILKNTLKKTSISYIYLSKVHIADFPYVIQMENFRNTFPVSFENDDGIMFYVQ